MAARMRKRADGRYVVTVTYEDSEGAKRRHFVYGRTQTEANAKAKAARDRLDAAPVRKASRTLSDWPAEWRATYPPTQNGEPPSLDPSPPPHAPTSPTVPPPASPSALAKHPGTAPLLALLVEE